MAISSHEAGDWGYFKVPSPDGKSFAEFKGLCEVGMGAPTRGDLWVNGRKISKERDYKAEEQNLAPVDYYSKFGPSCAWSHDSRYLALVKWSHKLKRGYSVSCAIYDVNSETLHSVATKRGWGLGYYIRDFQDVVKAMTIRCKSELGELMDLSPPTEAIELNAVPDIPLEPEVHEPVFEKTTDFKPAEPQVKESQSSANPKVDNTTSNYRVLRVIGTILRLIVSR